jgi:uncharacterized protein (DUF58 family)
VTRYPTRKLAAYTGVVALGLVGALAGGRPELVAVVAPFALLLLAGLVGARPPRLDARVDLDGERMVEGQAVRLDLELTAGAACEQVEVLVGVPAGLALEGGPNPTALPLAADAPARLTWTVHGRHWGLYRFGQAWLRVRDRFGLFHYETRVDDRRPLRV